MQIGLVGLGKMGIPILQRLARGGHDVVGFDAAEDALARCVEVGGTSAPSLEALVSRLSAPRVVWVMLPAGNPTRETIHSLSRLLQANDVIVDGGNSHYREAVLRASELEEAGIRFLDVGTSGGVRGLADGFSLMIGGSEETIDSLEPIFATLAPAPHRGWGRVGPVGAGHFVKMVHNGIEYGAMQAFAEGFAILNAKGDFDLDLEQVASIWQHGSVVRSWLLDLVWETLAADATLQGIAPVVADSGEGRWTVQEAIDLGVSAPVITLSLLTRLKSRDDTGFSERLLAALRNRFGGHAIDQIHRHGE
ncbi:MAG: decarboxylating 6-phosphogluconate dehydrogenase [Gemmatimonadota bacterium]|nr:decarboxylating 6-phosphogluconate dehydrogenase [Gemmatimonadota bacterium]